jgi:hypothetical protein
VCTKVSIKFSVLTQKLWNETQARNGYEKWRNGVKKEDKKLFPFFSTGSPSSVFLMARYNFTKSRLAEYVHYHCSLIYAYNLCHVIFFSSVTGHISLSIRMTFFASIFILSSFVYVFICARGLGNLTPRLSKNSPLQHLTPLLPACFVLLCHYL